MLPEETREKSNEAWLNAVLTNMVDGVITIDMRGTIQTMNPAAVRIFGHDTDEVIGRNVSMLAAEPDQSAHDGYISAYLETSKPKIIGFLRPVSGILAEPLAVVDGAIVLTPDFVPRLDREKIKAFTVAADHSGTTTVAV